MSNLILWIVAVSLMSVGTVLVLMGLDMESKQLMITGTMWIALAIPVNLVRGVSNA